jgi:hypothetical protein
MSIDFTGGGAAGIEMVNATNTWIRGVRLVYSSGPGSFVFHIVIVNGFRVTVKDNYVYGPTVQGNTQYAYAPHVTGSVLFENNILHHNTCPACPNDPEMGSVYAYNYVDDAFYATPGFQQHNGGDSYNLWEGNNSGNFFADDIHGTHHFLTFFRNHFDGTAHNRQGVTANSAFTLTAHARFFNAVGNVIGGSPFTTYQTSNTDSMVSVFNLGYRGNCSNCGGMANDAHVERTLFRWGNWDSVNNGTRFQASEVPSSIGNFPQGVPATQNLPVSLYLSSKPSWFGAAAWPPIGPDVTGGGITGFGGHANKIPARLCFESATNDAAYPSSSPRIKAFNATTCYGAGGTPPPAPPSAPTGLQIKP